MVVNDRYLDPERTGKHVAREVDEGLEILESIDNKLISVFGSHLTSQENEWYQHAYHVGKHLGQKGYGVITGGGPGIMEAANIGAFESGAPSVGFQASLISEEQVSKSHFTHHKGFVFMFVRRFVLAIKSDALIFYPGGFGTLNELYEYAVLMQTKMVDSVPIICVGKEYWGGMIDWIKNKMVDEGYVQADQVSMFHLVDDQEELFTLIP